MQRDSKFGWFTNVFGASIIIKIKFLPVYVLLYRLADEMQQNFSNLKLLILVLDFSKIIFGQNSFNRYFNLFFWWFSH